MIQKANTRSCCKERLTRPHFRHSLSLSTLPSEVLFQTPGHAAVSRGRHTATLHLAFYTHALQVGSVWTHVWENPKLVDLFACVWEAAFLSAGLSASGHNSFPCTHRRKQAELFTAERLIGDTVPSWRRKWNVRKRRSWTVNLMACCKIFRFSHRKRWMRYVGGASSPQLCTENNLKQTEASREPRHTFVKDVPEIGRKLDCAFYIHSTYINIKLIS